MEKETIEIIDLDDQPRRGKWWLLLPAALLGVLALVSFNIIRRCSK
jgi:hypothetical protein